MEWNIKNVLDIVSGETISTSKGEPETVWKMMDKCIFDISSYAVRLDWVGKVPREKVGNS